MSTNDLHLEALERDLELAFASPVPELRFEDALASRPLPHRAHRRAWSFAGVGTIAAGLVAAVAFLPGYLGGAEPVSAQELVNRSAAAASVTRQATSNYHMVTVSRLAGFERTTESWYGGPERNRSESRSSSADGDTSLEGTAILGDELWMYNDEGGALRVAHGPRLFDLEIPRTPTLADHIETWTDDKCFTAEITGKERLNGREAHVLTIIPAPETCPYQPKALKKVMLWIDTENDMSLKMLYEGEGAQENSSFELLLFETFQSLPDSAFEYIPPVGTEVVEFTTYSELKNAFIPIVPRGSTVTLTGPGTPAVEAATPGN